MVEMQVRTTLRWGSLSSAAASTQDTPAARTPSVASLASSWNTAGAQLPLPERLDEIQEGNTGSSEDDSMEQQSPWSDRVLSSSQ